MARKKKKKARRGTGGPGGEPAPPKVPERISRPFADALRGLAPASTTESRAETAAPQKPPAERSPDPAPEPPTASAVPGAPEYSYEDRAAYNVAFANVAPLGAPKRAKKGKRTAGSGEGAPRRLARPPTDAVDAHARARLASLVTGGLHFQVRREDGWVEGVRDDAPKARLTDLRHGRATPDSEIDLHGMTSDEAAAALVAFLRRERGQSRAIVRVIHGKGRNSAAGVGVLGDRVVDEITKGAAAPLVHAFVTTAIDAGGTGALLVRLDTR